MKKIFFCCLLLSSFIGAQKSIQPYGVTPSERQLAWHDVEVYGLIHFTPTTFENKEWGYGDADPKIFNPSQFDAEQIIKAAKAGGLKGIILVAKHHDGFALWPTHTTSYNISKSPFRNGKGDMVKEIQLAAQKNGLKFGVYCSPWDRNNPDYGTSKYLATYQAQLKELYSNYGNLFMSWHDGANGGDGYYGGARETRSIDSSTYYDWINTFAITRKMQPMASIFSRDVRWVGNEEGYAAETSWATFTPGTPLGKHEKIPGQPDYPEGTTGTRNGKLWMPAECDVPLRKGWFFHAEEKPKSAEVLFDLYLKSVGRGAALDLGLAPDTTGRLHDDDIAVLQAFGNMVQKTFSKNLAEGATIKASNIRDEIHGTQTLLDRDKQSFWATQDDVYQADLEIVLPNEKTFDIISLQEFIPLGQRIEGYTLEVFTNNKWGRIYEGKSIGAKKLIKLDQPLTTNKLRLSITKSPVCITLSELGLYKKASL
ncbi:alpha-L-fucosidase [Chryseobacterium lactis]|uniref:alpha-L-fucosidase n=1 Tax=Chryseobacterium lactis TaxID=1241981 RepID=A0A3G6RUA3_CHRLC|nr:alpha-L-fucosidase [Chryseobacterium lactis]AZA80464.1 alpha-L-fucosidase [Chryseobacterium lactis]AZB05466.1 alpha-L-fucosidase [Chryseobacterium lactis]PNW11399.1 alpha-L-fucosidase [Chryseobacterium lactis]